MRTILLFGKGAEKNFSIRFPNNLYIETDAIDFSTHIPDNDNTSIIYRDENVVVGQEFLSRFKYKTVIVVNGKISIRKNDEEVYQWIKY